MSKEQPVKNTTTKRRLIDYTGVSLSALAVSATAYAFTTFATKDEMKNVDTAMRMVVQVIHKLDIRLSRMEILLERIDRRHGRTSEND